MHWPRPLLAAIGAAAFTAGLGAGAWPVLAGDTVAPAAPPHPVYRTGATPIDPDAYAALPKLPTFRAFLPQSVDLTPYFPKPGNQGDKPDCVAWATTYAARSFLSGRDLGRQPALPSEEMSPAYVYNRLRPPGSQCDRPTVMVDALRVLKQEGTVTLSEFPDDLRACATPAPQAMISRAAQNRLGGWDTIDAVKSGLYKSAINVDDIKGAIAQELPVVFTMPATDDLYALHDDAVFTHLTRENGNFHAMAVIGYDDGRQAFRVINSWGAGWGDHGYAWIGYGTFRALVHEAYALHDERRDDMAHPAPKLSPQQALYNDIDKLGCGSAEMTTVGHHYSITGYAGDADKLDRLHAALLAIDPTTTWTMAHHPWPQCEAEQTLGKSRITGDVAMVAMTETGASRTGDPVAMHAGELFGIGVDVPASKPLLSIIYLQKDGSAVELYHGTAAPATPGHHSVTIGLGGTAETRFQVGPPYGDEMVIALASDRPLFGKELGDYASDRQFLSELRAKLIKAPTGAVSASILRIRTHQ